MYNGGMRDVPHARLAETRRTGSAVRPARLLVRAHKNIGDHRLSGKIRAQRFLPHFRSGSHMPTTRRLLQAGRRAVCRQAGSDDHSCADNPAFAERGRSKVKIGVLASVHGRPGGEESGLGGTRQGRASWWSFPAATPRDTPRPGSPAPPPEHRTLTHLLAIRNFRISRAVLAIVGSGQRQGVPLF